MTNEISLRTNKSEYNTGENIFGVVYLRINTPTRGSGIRIKFKGYEKFEYEDKTKIVDDNPVCYTDHRDYINFNEVLYQSDGPLNMCITYFPFKIPLPVEIPGTFLSRKETEEMKWEARVEYLLEAEVIDASRVLATEQYLTIRQPLTRDIKPSDNPAAVIASYQKTLVLFFSTSVDVTARMHDHIHRTGENARLRIIITNNSSVTVQSLRLQLHRSTTLIKRKLEGGEGKLCLLPEVKEKVGQEQNISMTRFPKGLDNIQLPLRDANNRPLCPSVRGQHIICQYEVLVTIFLSNGDTFDLSVPISVIVAEKNKQWECWVPPGWVTNDSPNIQHSIDSVLRVPENVLSSEAFSSIPGFQPL